jgi:S-adenosylmethionine:tRNA ribosyltransferase-isomerase
MKAHRLGNFNYSSFSVQEFSIQSNNANCYSKSILSPPLRQALPLTYTIADYEYDLPHELIADKPLPERDQSRLLVINRADQSISHSRFDKLSEFLKKGDVVVVNDTKVIPAKLVARRSSGGFVRVLLIKHEANQPGIWQAMVSPIKRLKSEEILYVSTANGEERPITIKAIITAEDGFKRVLVDLGSGASVFKLLDEIGQAPLPPYIMRNQNNAAIDRADDLKRYQTVFAQAPGAVAAPTAGLHFSDQLMQELTKGGITIVKLTLHVGPGTFKPIENSVEEHFIEAENYSISAETAEIINQAKKEGRRIIAVGTTSLRALESAAQDGQLRAVSDENTSLYIRPGHYFSIVDGLITNFHLSRSSLLILVSTFAGHDLIMRAYTEAIKEKYRFYSYGDSSLII